jgi:hypothetical protein
MRKNVFEDELDEEVKTQIKMSLSDKKSMQNNTRVVFTNGLLNKLQHFAKDKIHSNKDIQETNIDHDQLLRYGQVMNKSETIYKFFKLCSQCQLICL